jgi:hypothetical protein
MSDFDLYSTLIGWSTDAELSVATKVQIFYWSGTVEA